MYFYCFLNNVSLGVLVIKCLWTILLNFHHFSMLYKCKTLVRALQNEENITGQSVTLIYNLNFWLYICFIQNSYHKILSKILFFFIFGCCENAKCYCSLCKLKKMERIKNSFLFIKKSFFLNICFIQSSQLIKCWSNFV